MQALREQLIEFLFRPATDRWLTLLRVGLGLHVTFYSLSLRNDWNYLLSGTVRSVAEALLSLQSQFIPRLGWSINLGAEIGLHEESVLVVAWACLVVAGCGLLLGVACRLSAIVAWFFHLCAAKSGGFVSYGMDNLMTIGLFYLMLSPVPDRYSLDWRLQKSPSRDPQLLGFWQRVLQVHLAFIYFFGGVAKALGSGWWNGTSLWRALTRAPFNLIPAEILIHFKHVFPIAGMMVCFLEIGYAFAIWHRRTRVIWLTCIVAMHIGIGLAMGMYLFAFIMIVLNAAAFGPELIFRQRKQAELFATS